MIDAAIDRVLGLAAAHPDGADDARLVAFQRILLLHLAVRFATGAYARSLVSTELHYAVVAAFAGCFALSWVRRFLPLAVAGAFATMLLVLHATFPQTANHFFLELWCLGLAVLIGVEDDDSRVLLTAATRWSIVIVLFYTGVQKILYGTYFEAQFLSFEVVTKPYFEQVFSWMMSAEELARLKAIPPNVPGAGPFRGESLRFLLASNAVYVFELVAPAALLWKRTRPWAVIAVCLFTVAIQSGARELFFGGVLVNSALLFWPNNAHDRALPFFALFYAGLLGARLAGIEGGFY